MSAMVLHGGLAALARTTSVHAQPHISSCSLPPGFLDRIKQAYQRNPELPNLLVDPAFAQDMAER